MLPIGFVTYDSLTRTEAHPQELEWNALTELLTRPMAPAKVARKELMQLWSPVRLTKPKRGNEFVKEVTALVLDIDGASDEQWSSIVLSLREQDLAWCAHSTFSHRPPRNYWRLVIQLSVPVPADKWAAFWPAAIKAIGLANAVDMGCKDPSRAFFLPCAGDNFGSLIERGEPLDVDAIALEDPPGNGHAIEPVGVWQIYPPANRLGDDHPWAIAALKRWVDKIAALPQDSGTRNITLCRAAFQLGHMAPHGIAETTIARELTTAALACGLTEPEISRTIRSGLTSGKTKPNFGPQNCLLNRGGTPTPANANGGLSVELMQPGSALPRGPAPAGVPAHELVDAIIEENKLPRVSTGFSQIDYHLGGGLIAHTMTTLIAGTGRGKTAWAVQLASRHALKGPAIYYSGELTPGQLAARCIAQQSGLSWREVLGCALSRDRMLEILKPMNLRVIRSCPDPIRQLEADVAAALKAGGVPLVCVDYAQIVADIGDDMRISVMAAVKGLHRLAESNPIVLVLLAQGSRASSRQMKEGEGTADDYVHAGAETSAIEQASANVLTILMAPKDGEDTHSGAIAVAKARYGTMGKVGFDFHGPSGLWTEHAERVVLSKVELERRERIWEVCFDTRPMTKNEICREAGGNRQQLLATIREMVAAGALKEHPGGSLIRGVKLHQGGSGGSETRQIA